MKLDEILSFLEEIAPGSFQESYDNSGLILGSPDAELSKILVCLDADSKAIDYAIRQNCDTVLSHHPAIFKAIKTFTADTREGAFLVKAIKNNIALVSCHTNFDSACGGLTDLLCSRIGLNNIIILKKAASDDHGFGRFGNIVKMSGKEFIDLLRSKLSIDVLRMVGEVPECILTVAVYNGSYDHDILDSLLRLNPDVLVTGDLKYHDAQELMEKGVFTIDAGHYGTEKLFVEEMARFIKARFPDLEVSQFEGTDVFTYTCDVT
jgi:dinuclear metal center YbgI/SA1388 family protein